MSREFTGENEPVIRAKVKFVRTWSAVAGLIHLLAAILLVWSSVAPGKLPQLLPVPPDTPSGLIGILSCICAVLVGGMGLAYLSVVVGRGRTGVMVWFATALLHGLGAVYLIWRIDTDELPAFWLPQVLPGLVVAVVQIAVVRAGWWDSVRKWQIYPGGRNSSRGRWK